MTVRCNKSKTKLTRAKCIQGLRCTMAIPSHRRSNNNTQILELCHTGQSSRTNPDKSITIEQLNYRLVDVDPEAIATAKIPKNGQL